MTHFPSFGRFASPALRGALVALLGLSAVALAGCSSSHPMIKSGQACISCHGDDRTAVDAPDLSNATETGLTFAIESGADEVYLCSASVAENGTVIPERQRSVPASEFGEVTVSSPGLYALCTGDVASPSATVLINATDSGPTDVAVRV